MSLRRTIIAIMMSIAVVSVAYGNPDSMEWSDSTMTLNEVSVTAIKGKTVAENAPVAVTVIDRRIIENRDILNVKSAAVLTPNFYIPDYGSRMTSSVYVRGVGARIDQPAVGLNIDNVPVLNKDNYDFDISEIERIEMFRGPQSTLYGRNTMAGLINVYTLSPLRFQGVKALFSLGSESTVNASGGYYMKLSKTLGMSLSASVGSSSGFFVNEYNGQKVDHEKNVSARWKTQWITGDIKVENTASFSHNRQGGYPYESLSTGKICYNDTCFYRRASFTDGLTVRLPISSVELSSITSFQYIKDNMTLDQDFLPIDYFTLTQRRHEWTFTQDVVLKGSISNFNWLGGLFGFYKRSNMSAPVTFKDDGVATLIEKNVNRPGSFYPITWDSREFVLNSDFIIPTSGFAIYHHSGLQLGRFTLGADLRVDYEHVALDYHNYTHTSYTQMDATVDPAVLFQRVAIDIDDSDRLSKSFLQLLPKFSVEYNLSPVTLYATVAKGYKAGGYNTQMFSNVLQQRLMSKFGIAQTAEVKDVVSYKPEKSWNYEIGTKFNIPSASLSGSAALFYIDCRDQQLTMFPPGLITGRMMTNAGKARSKGIEVSAIWNPIDPMTVSVAYGFTDARFVRYNDGREDYRNKRVPYAPRNTLYGAVDYRLHVKSSVMNGVTLHCGVHGVGSICWDESNTVTQPFYALFEASVACDFLDSLCTFELRADNLLNKDYDVFYFVSMNNQFVQRGKPRFIGGSLRFNI